MNHEKCYIDWESAWADFEDWFNDQDGEPDWDEQEVRIEELVRDYMIR